jgi:transcriptional regulator with XRE-family HTH domain
MDVTTTNGAANGATMGRGARVVKPEVFGKALHDARMDVRMGNDEFCRIFGVSKSALYRWERGEGVPQARYLTKLRERFPGLPHVRASEPTTPLFLSPPMVIAKPAAEPAPVVEKPHLATEATTATLGDYAEAVAEIERCRRALENAVERAESIHLRIMGKIR